MGEEGKKREQKVERPEYIAVVEFILRNGDGFFHNPELRERFGRPVYCFRTVLGPAGCLVNDCVGFKLHINKKGFPAASGPLWRLHGNDQPGVLQSFGDCVGTVIETLPDGGALICSEEASAKYGRNDVTAEKDFVDRAKIVAGDIIAFQVQQATDGTLEAVLPVWKMSNDRMAAENFRLEQEELQGKGGKKGMPGGPMPGGPMPGMPGGPMQGKGGKSHGQEDNSAIQDIPAIPWPPPEPASSDFPAPPWPPLEDMNGGANQQQQLVPVTQQPQMPSAPKAPAERRVMQQAPQQSAFPIPRGLGGVLDAHDFPQYIGVVYNVTGAGDALLRCPDLEHKFGRPVSVDAGLLQTAQAVEDDCLAFKLGEGALGPIALGPLWKLVGRNANHGELTPFGEYIGSVTWKREDGSGTVSSTDAARVFGGNRIMDSSGQMRGADVIIKAPAFKSCRLLVGDIVSFNVHRENAYSDPLGLEPMFRLMKQDFVQMAPAPMAPAPMMNPSMGSPMGPPMGDMGMAPQMQMVQTQLPSGPPPPMMPMQSSGMPTMAHMDQSPAPGGQRPGWINNLAQKRRRVADVID